MRHAPLALLLGITLAGCAAHAPPPPPVATLQTPAPPVAAPAPPPPAEGGPRFKAETTINFVDEVSGPADGPDIEVITAAPKKAAFESLVKSRKRPPAEEPILDDDEKK